MADIRFNDIVLDDFERPDEVPVEPPWYNGTSTHPESMRIVDAAIEGQQFPSNPNRAYLSTEAYTDTHIEAWALGSGGSPAETAGWRLGLTTGYPPSGYECLINNFIGGMAWVLRRLDSEVITEFGFAGGPGVTNAHALMQLTPDGVFCYYSNDGGANWTLVISAGDTTYRSGLYVTLGHTGTETAWEEVGGGIEDDLVQIYRRPNE